MRSMAKPSVTVTSGTDAALKDLGDRCETLKILAQEAQFAAEGGDPQELAEACEKLLPVHVQFAQAYRMWLVRRQPPPGESMST